MSNNKYQMTNMLNEAFLSLALRFQEILPLTLTLSPGVPGEREQWSVTMLRSILPVICHLLFVISPLLSPNFIL